MAISRTILLICFLSLSLFSIQAFQLCEGVIVEQRALFDLCPLMQRPVYNLTYEKRNYLFSLVTPRVTPCNPPNKDARVYAIRKDTWDPFTCVDVAESTDPTYSLVDKTNINSGLVITFPKSAKVDQQIIVTLMCDSKGDKASDITYQVSKADETRQHIWINGTHALGCAKFDVDILVNFIENNKIAFTIGFAVIGLFVGFFGLKLFKAAIFLITTVGGSLVACDLFFRLATFGRQDWVYYVIFGASLIIGMALGALAVKFEKVGFVALGALLGVIGGFFLYYAAIVHFFINTVYPYYATLGICALIGGVLTVWLRKDIIIIATSIIGGYLTMRSISLLVGHFPSEVDVARGAKPLDVWAYCYLGGAIVLALVSMYYQFTVKRKDTEKEEDEEDEEKDTSSYYQKA